MRVVILVLCFVLFPVSVLGKELLPPNATIAISSNNTVCQNSGGPSITFTGSGGATPYIFTYTINGGAQQTVTSNGAGIAAITANTSMAGGRTYALVTVEDNANVAIGVGGSVSFNVAPQPDATMGGTGGGTSFGGIPVFRVCSNTTSTLNFTNTSTSTGTNQTYTIDWGDLTPNFTGTTWTALTHAYNVGIHTLTYNIIGTNGCSITKVYTVFVGSNPAVALGNPGNTDICSNQILTFPITGTTNNPLGTIYTVTFNDGSAPVLFNHPPPSSVSHTFSLSSCNTTSSDGSNTYPNSFSANIVASNPCSTSSVGVVPIYVSATPQSDFAVPPASCIGTQVCLTSTSSGNQVLDGSCSNPQIIWTISPSTGFTVSGGSLLGNDFGFTDSSLWQSGSDNLCVVFSVAGTYTVSLKIGNKCGIDTETKTICIAAPLSPQYTLNNTTGCTPLNVTATNTTDFTALCGTATNTWSVTHTPANCGSAIIPIANQTTSNASYNFTEPGTYNITLTTTNSCGTTNTSQTVNVKKPPTASINQISGFCGPGSISPVAVVNACSPAALTYNWTFPGGTPASSASANPGSITYSTPGNYTASLVVTNECGNSNTATSSFTVNPTQTITNTDLAQSSCSGSLTSAINLTSTLPGTTFNWTVTAGPNLSAYEPSGSGTVIPAHSIIYSGTGTGTLTYIVTPTLNGCSGPSVNFVFTVAPAPTITQQPQPQTLCVGGTANALSVNVSSGGPTYQWFSNTTNAIAAGTAISGATSQTYIPPTTSAGVLYYYNLITLTSGGCSQLTSGIAAMTVEPLPQVTSQPTPMQQLCVGGSLAGPFSVTTTGGTGAVSYQWFSNNSASTTGGSPIGGATAQQYNPSVFNTVGTFYYYVTATYSGMGCGAVTSQLSQVDVIADPVISQQPFTPQNLCQGATPQVLSIIATGGSGLFSYQWFSNLTNVPFGGTAIPGATPSSYTPLTSAIGTLYYYCVVTQPVSGCSVASQTAAVIVNSSPSITTQPLPSEVCVGGVPQTLTFTTASGAGTATYQWFSSTTAVNSGGTLIPGATSATFIPPATNVGILYYYAEVAFSGIIGSCSTIATNAAEIEVTPAAQITTQPEPDHTLCVGGSIAAALTIAHTGGSGTPTYQWYQNTTNTTSGGTPIAGTNAPSYLPGVFNSAGIYYYYATVTLSSSGCSAVPSDLVTVTVLADPVINQQPITPQNLCSGATPQNLSVSASGGSGTFSYQWYSNTTNANSGGSLIAGATSDTYTPDTTLIGTKYYYCVITQPVSGCNVTSATAEVIVNTSPSVITQPLPSEICVGGTPQSLSFVTASGAGTETYQWFYTSADVNAGGTLITGATSATYTPPAAVAGILYYYAEITFSGIAGSCATIATNTAEVNVTLPPQITSQPLPINTLCVGGSLSTPLTVTYTGGSGTASYQWYQNSTNTTSGGTAVGTNDASYLPPAYTSAGTFYYYVTISLSSSGCGNTTSEVAAVNVLTDPTVVQQPQALQTVCQNEVPQTLTVSSTGGVGTTYLYQWYVATTATPGSGTLIAGADLPNYIPPTDAIGTLYYYCVITQPGNLGCNAESDFASIIVSPSPQITVQPQSDTDCIGIAIPALDLTVVNGVGVPNYQWFTNTSAVNSGGSAILNANAQTYQPSSLTEGIFYYYCEINFPDLAGSCSQIISDVAIITILQNPVIANKTEIICSATSFTIDATDFTSDIVPAGTTFTWTDPVVSPAASVTGASASAGAPTEITQQLINTTILPATVTYTVLPVAGPCPGNPFTITVTVNPAINANVTLFDNLCFGAGSASISTNVTGGIPFPGTNPYQFDWSGPDGFTSAQSAISNLEPGSYQLTILDAGGCPFTQIYTITEPTELLFSSFSDVDVTCNGFADGIINIDITGGIAPYFYVWTKGTQFYSNTEYLTGLSPEMYTVVVTDANNCGPISMTFTIIEPQPLIAVVSNQVNVECFGESTGAIAVTVTGGTQIETSPGIFDYQYAWTGPNGYVNSTKDISSLFAGTYSLVVTDANNCEFNLPVTITSNPEIIISYTTTEISCYGANDATMIVTISGGEAPYQYTWSNLSTLLTQTNLSAGNYTIVVLDSFGCSRSVTIPIPEAPIFTVDPVVTQITCNGADNGSIQLNLTGGIAPVTMIWNDGSQAGLTRNGLSPGTYTATITDSKPCQIVRTFIIVEPQPLALSAQIDNATDCNSSNGGAIDILVSGGTPPYSYSWSNGSSTEDLTQLTNGNYAVTVTDSRGCVVQAQYSVMRPDPIVITVTTQTDFDCETHTVSQDFVAQVTGGFAPYQLQWTSGTVSGTNNQIMHTDTNGVVILTVTDALGCTMDYSLNVEIPILGYPDFEPGSIGYESYGIFSIQDPITFHSTATGDFEAVVWDFGDGTFSSELDPVHTYLTSGSYVVTQKVRYPFVCTYVKVITLVVEEGYFLTIPTAFTPNQDSLNDNYRPVSKRLQAIKLEVYDSWGSMIYSETGDSLVGWNGEIKDVPAENGNYYCTVTARTFYGRIVHETRTFVLIK